MALDTEKNSACVGDLQSWRSKGKQITNELELHAFPEATKVRETAHQLDNAKTLEDAKNGAARAKALWADFIRYDKSMFSGQARDLDKIRDDERATRKQEEALGLEVNKRQLLEDTMSAAVETHRGQQVILKTEIEGLDKQTVALSNKKMAAQKKLDLIASRVAPHTDKLVTFESKIQEFQAKLGEIGEKEEEAEKRMTGVQEEMRALLGLPVAEKMEKTKVVREEFKVVKARKDELKQERTEVEKEIERVKGEKTEAVKQVDEVRKQFKHDEAVSALQLIEEEIRKLQEKLADKKGELEEEVKKEAEKEKELQSLKGRGKTSEFAEAERRYELRREVVECLRKQTENQEKMLVRYDQVVGSTVRLLDVLGEVVAWHMEAEHEDQWFKVSQEEAEAVYKKLQGSNKRTADQASGTAEDPFAEGNWSKVKCRQCAGSPVGIGIGSSLNHGNVVYFSPCLCPDFPFNTWGMYNPVDVSENIGEGPYGCGDAAKVLGRELETASDVWCRMVGMERVATAIQTQVDRKEVEVTGKRRQVLARLMAMQPPPQRMQE
eukprot:comp10948_c0_seq1/m.5523 comp10948_c0_seq1/g.5523  ORF comp10948_c0_seq1/g.5523 comp10948_c0_seq1/m.5523 type:complete len:551 (-) comp10948_c0_seq1:185-1837(-)